MSLVAYASSDDSDGSEEESGEIKTSAPEVQSTVTVSLSASVTDNNKDTSEKSKADNERPAIHKNNKDSNNDIGSSINDIEDEDDWDPTRKGGLTMTLPPPKHSETVTSSSLIGPTNTGLLSGLPVPKSTTAATTPDGEDELEEEVKPKEWEKELAEKPPPKPKKRPTIKIAAPSLDQFDSDEEDKPAKKKPKPSTGKGGFLSLLPAPKNAKTTNRILIPHTLTKKTSTAPKKPTLAANPPATVKSSSPTETPAQSKLPGVPDMDISDEDDDDYQPSSFFSLDKDSSSLPGASLSSPALSGVGPKEAAPKVETVLVNPSQILPPSGTAGDNNPSQIPPSSGTDEDKSEDAQDTTPPLQDEPLDFSVNAELQDAPLIFSSRPAGFVSASYSRFQQGRQYGVQPGASGSAVNEEAESGQGDEGEMEAQSSEEMQEFMQDEQFLRLTGKNKRSKEFEGMNIIDVNADEYLDPSSYMKNMTEETEMVSHSRKKKDQPTQQSKRKHQITYLAYQAKERELTLKQQWAENKTSKKATQSKYGF